MQSVSIPVSPLSLRIIRREYGPADPLRLPTHSELLKLLHHRPTADKYKQRQQHSLTAELHLSVHEDLARQIREHAGAIGYFIFDQHKRRIFREVYARYESRTLGKGGALGCIQEILARYFVEEDDYATETAERLYKRWRKDRENRLSKYVSTVPHLTTTMYLHQLSERQARKVHVRMRRLIEDGVVLFDRRNRSSLLPFLLCTYTPMTTREVADCLGLFQQSVQRSTTRMRLMIEQDEPLSRLLRYCLDTTRAVPVPNLAS